MKIKVKPSVAREIWAIIYLVIGILMVLSMRRTFGVMGDSWINIFSPVLGWGIYMIPLVFFLISGMMFFSKKMHFGTARILGLFMMVVSVLSILHLSVPVDKIHDYAALGDMVVTLVL